MNCPSRISQGSCGWAEHICSLPALLQTGTGRKLPGRFNIDAPVQRSVKRTMQGIVVVHCFDYATNFLLSNQPMVDQDTPDHKHAVLGLHLATQLTQECPSTRLHVPRCQRGSKCAL